MYDDEMNELLESIDGLDDLLDEFAFEGMDDDFLQEVYDDFTDVRAHALQAPEVVPPPVQPTGVYGLFQTDEFSSAGPARWLWTARPKWRQPSPPRAPVSHSEDVANIRIAQSRIEDAIRRVRAMGAFSKTVGV